MPGFYTLLARCVQRAERSVGDKIETWYLIYYFNLVENFKPLLSVNKIWILNLKFTNCYLVKWLHCKARQTGELQTGPKTALYSACFWSPAFSQPVWLSGGMVAWGDPSPSFSHCRECIYYFNTSCVSPRHITVLILFPVCKILGKCGMWGRGWREGQTEARSGERRNHLYWSPYKDIRLQALTV